MANVLSVAGQNSKYKLPNSEPAGFLAGLWHGLIFPITFIVSIFNPNVKIYETNNKGLSYEFRFILGAAGSFGRSSAKVHDGVF